MDKILNWSLAHQSGDEEAIKRVGDLDPKMLEQLFGGPDEPTLMKQAIMIINADAATLENKEIAFDNFEMLIENLDNANNIENMKLWPSIISQLSSNIAPSLRLYAASVIAIAVQNNPNAQEAFNKTDGLEKLINIASDDETSKDLLLKVLLALSSLIRNYEPGYRKFNELDGWKIITAIKNENLQDHKVKLRVLSVISSVLSTGLSAEKQVQLHEHKLIDYLVSILDKDGHSGCIDKALNIVSQLSGEGYQFTANEIADLAQGLENVQHLKETLSTDDYDAAKKIIG
ncbi:Hsp70 nucleotide exchange factor FES1 [Scheffersomyces amazonensis]|uniref:Hsp70 nucleotide exchange factor FES1 n=1 Tax=Scheffersomyces amazonensis TaxID=1078765 RepID=UPI00315DAB32